MLIRGIYYEGWDPAFKPQRVRHKEEFLACVQQQLRDEGLIDPEQITRAVFAIVESHISEGEIEDVKAMLPSELRQLWPSSTKVHR